VEDYVPKIIDIVTTTIPGFSGSFIVTRSDAATETADIESLPVSEHSSYILGSVKWKAIRPLDLSRSTLAS
jgi:hypothetical protein